MKWMFINANLLTEFETSFTIRLMSGSWSEPTDIKPDQSGISFYEQARLIREGLAFAKESSLEEMT